MTVSSLDLVSPQYKVTHKTHTGFVSWLSQVKFGGTVLHIFLFCTYKASFLQTQADIDTLSEFISPGCTDYS